jgi:hypothetical protein
MRRASPQAQKRTCAQVSSHVKLFGTIWAQNLTRPKTAAPPSILEVLQGRDIRDLRVPQIKAREALEVLQGRDIRDLRARQSKAREALEVPQGRDIRDLRARQIEAREALEVLEGRDIRDLLLGAISIEFFPGDGGGSASLKMIVAAVDEQETQPVKFLFLALSWNKCLD